MALVQARHFVASAGTVSLQYRQTLVGGPGTSGTTRTSSDVITYTTMATMIKTMTTLINAPYRIATSVLGSADALRTTCSCEKSRLPRREPMGGMMMSLTSELTTLPTATPIITPTAKARALALSKNSLKPDTQSLLGLRRAVVRGRAHERPRQRQHSPAVWGAPRSRSPGLAPELRPEGRCYDDRDAAWIAPLTREAGNGRGRPREERIELAGAKLSHSTCWRRDGRRQLRGAANRVRGTTGIPAGRIRAAAGLSAGVRHTPGLRPPRLSAGDMASDGLGADQVRPGAAQPIRGRIQPGRNWTSPCGSAHRRGLCLRHLAAGRLPRCARGR